MKILCIGDIVGRAGLTIFSKLIKDLKYEFQIDLTVVNGENAAAGSGITPKLANELFESGADVLTLGDHCWDKKEIFDYLDKKEMIIRPSNFPEGAPGKGVTLIDTPKGKVAVINLIGRTFMKYNVDCPFRAFDNLIKELPKSVTTIVVDFHAETTSEKCAFGWYADGKASIVFGTHTHIQTADEKIHPGGTAYITDLGMTGPYNSVIGSIKKNIIDRFITSIPCKFEVATQNPILHGIVVDVDDKTGKALSIERVQRF